MLDLSLQKNDESNYNQTSEGSSPKTFTGRSTKSSNFNLAVCDVEKPSEKKSASKTMESLAAQLSLTLFNQSFMNNAKQKTLINNGLKQTNRRKLNKTRKISAGFV